VLDNGATFSNPHIAGVRFSDGRFATAASFVAPVYINLEVITGRFDGLIFSHWIIYENGIVTKSYDLELTLETEDNRILVFANFITAEDD